MSEDLMARVTEVIGTDIRPALQMDGGDIELVSVEEGVVRVRLQGACKGCPGARMTLQMGVQARLQEKIPEVKSVEAVD
jgi:Fe-S cluster biogenesis protein NfuA